MPQAHKLRLGDGSVIELQRADMRSWYERGLIGDDTPVQPPGSSSWTRLSQAVDVREWRGRRTASAPARRPSASTPAARPSTGRSSAARAHAGGARVSYPPEWPRRLAWGGVLLAVAALAVSFELWWPPLMRLAGRTPATPPPAGPTVDDVQRRHREAVQAAVAALPQLRSDTVELLMSSSAAGLLEPADVFRRSYEAAGRGLAALDRTEARELAALNGALSAALSARERVLLADYIERVRSRRPTSLAEDGEMSRLVRRAALTLPPARRARLQELLAEAIAAALDRPAQPPAAPAAGDVTR
jgi:hypothetical protein